MEKCLVTRLEGSVTDDSLMKFNEWRFKLVDNIIVNPQNKVLSEVGRLRFLINKKVTLTLTGTAVFLDPKDQNKVLGQSLNLDPPTWPSTEDTLVGIRYGNGDSELSISDKTAFKKLGNYYLSGETNAGMSQFHTDREGYSLFTKKMFVCKTEDFKYVTLSDIGLGAVDVSGDIEDINVKELQAFSIINLRAGEEGGAPHTNVSSKLYGDASSLLKRPLKLLEIKWSKVTGNIKDLNTTVLTNLRIDGSKISGDVSTIAFSGVLNGFVLGHTSGKGVYESIGYNLYGDICKSLAQSSKLTLVRADGMNKFSGDIGQISPSICLFSNLDGDSQFSYNITANRQYILGLNSIKIPNIDEVLIYMATLPLNPNFENSSSYKVMFLRGTRTSASDSAITTLQSKGITVTINNN